jgi:hypothetical protein
MRRVEILRLLLAQPFQIRLSNGTTGAIRHPDMALPTPSAVHLTGNDVLPDLKWRVADLFRLPGEAAS